MSDAAHCQSCGMGIEGGVYCGHCTDADGRLQSFEERFEGMVQWLQREGRAASREEAESLTLASMATMPAWRDHPQVRAGGG
ncbi:MAG: hypothetical protein GY778_26465 [bacterium]|nr:hypothetical protein [bacterium]